jgi:hypothetical protein
VYNDAGDNQVKKKSGVLFLFLSLILAKLVSIARHQMENSAADMCKTSTIHQVF